MPAGAFFPCHNKNQVAWVCTAKVSKGRSQSPLVAPAGAKSPACGKEPLWSQDQLCGRAHLARQYAASWIERLGGAPAGARSYWQGRFAACTFVDFSFGMVARATVGALPQTPQGAPPPLTPQGTLSLDPFWLPSLGALPLLFLFLRLFLLIQGFFPVKHLPHLPLRFLHHPVALLNRVLLRVVINLRPE